MPAGPTDVRYYTMALPDARFAHLVIVSPAVRAGLYYWIERRQDDRPPRRADIDPVDIPSLLPHVVLLDVQREPRDFRYRLVGSKVRYHLMADLLGRWMSEVPHQKAPGHLWTKCCEATERMAPVLSNTPYIGPHKDFLRAEDLILPLCDDSGQAGMLLIFVDFLHKNSSLAALYAAR